MVKLKPANDHGQLPDIQSKERWDTVHARYISTPKMTSWGRELAAGFEHTNIMFKTRVASLDEQTTHSDDKKTELFDETGESLGWFDWVICTAPNGQAVELMADSGFSQQDNITQPQMQACYTLMLGWDNAQELPETLNSQTAAQWDVAYLNSDVLDRIFIEHHKPAHDELLPSITIHARNDWSEARVDDDLETVKAALLMAAQRALNWNDDRAPSQTDCHRWRYAATIIDTDTQELGILVDETRQWIISGDWCARGNIESCYQVAQQTVEAIYKTR